ncbi:NHL repeat-containing protein [Candidatus Poribacteria bacterium]|nr:NHL repeat-containing protein [Candidatus Poribacteria bacterium]
MTKFRTFLIGIFILFFHFNASAHREVKFVQEFGGKGEQHGQIAETMFMTFDREGGIYITDTDNFRIQKLDPNGLFQFEIKGTASGQFRFINPTDIAVGIDGTIYVMDWVIVPIEGTSDPKIFNYGPCVHRFDSEGKFVASYPIQDFSRRIKLLEAAAPGIDAEGNYALIIPQGDTERSFLLTVDEQGNIYVFDDGKIYKLDENGQPVTTYAVSQPKAGQVIQAGDMTVDRQGNLFIVDKKAHRVLKYSAEGKFTQSFGEYGDKAGQFISPFLIIALDDGTLLIADKAKYKKDYVSGLPRRRYDPLQSERFLGVVDDNLTQAFQLGVLPYRVFRTRFRRVQRFYASGEYAEKILIRFERENEQHLHLNLKAIDYSGNLYFINSETLKFKKFALTSALTSSAFQTEFKLRYTFDIEDVEIDNQDDLDADFFNKADFDERLIQNAVDAKVTFSYDVNENLRGSMSNTLSYARLTDKSFYRARDFEDFRGVFNQDDESIQTFWEDRVQLGVNLIRNHNPYRYQEAGAFVYFVVTRNDFINKALDSRNFRVFDFRARISDWGAGLRYDLGRAFRLQFQVVHFFGYNIFTYIDETNILYATGFQEADFTSAILRIDGVF